MLETCCGQGNWRIELSQTLNIPVALKPFPSKILMSSFALPISTGWGCEGWWVMMTLLSWILASMLLKKTEELKV